MAPLIKEVGLSLLFLTTTLASLSKPPHHSNATLNLGHTPNNLAARDFTWTCDPGYAECSLNTLYCCPTGDGCCSTGYCTEPGDVCCSIGTCPSGWDCCGNAGYCSPSDGECCEDGSYCDAGYSCQLEYGLVVCCPDEGCGSDGSGDLGSTGTIESVTAFETETTVGYTYTYAPTSYSFETGYTYSELQFYYTTYYWTYWFYFWTSYAPYTVQTVTSTETTTTTVWSIYASDSEEASASLSLSVEEYTFTTPLSATSLRSSTDPVPIKTGAAGTPTATGRAGAQAGAGAATSVRVDSWVPWAIVTFMGLMGALAVGL